MASGSLLVLWGRKNLAVARILLADDQRDVLEALRILLKSEGYQTEGVTSLPGIFHALEKKEYALLLMDLNYTRDTTSGQEGLSAIPKIQEIDNTLPIVVMTAWATIELAVDALRILLKSEGYQTEGVTSLPGIFHALEKKEYALLLMDLNYTRDTTSGQEGLSAIPKIQEIDNTLPIVVMTAWATIELAVDAM